MEIGLVLFLLVFFLAEGAALAGRVRATVGEDKATLGRMLLFGRDVGRYFALGALKSAL